VLFLDGLMFYFQGKIFGYFLKGYKRYYFYFFCLLKGKNDIVRCCGTEWYFGYAMSKNTLHFVMDGEFLSLVIVNTPNNEKKHVRVYHFVFFIYLYFIIYFVYIFL
jgi:hypothetical protein